MENFNVNPSIRTLQDDPQFFGAYLNMARHNVFLIVNHISEKFGFNKLENDSLIDNKCHNILLEVFNDEFPYHKEYRDKVFHYLKRFLPMIKVFNPEDLPKPKTNKGGTTRLKEINNIDFTKLHNFLTRIFRDLNEFRNSYTHYLAFDNITLTELSRKEYLEKTIQNDFKDIFRFASQYSFYNFESTQDAVSDAHQIEDFEHLKNYKLFDEQGGQFTPQGFFFFICLFIERHYGILFLKKFRGFKNETNQAFIATLRVFTTYGIKLPQEKLLSDDPKQSLFLDILNELNKCPEELYKHITEEERSKFDPIIDKKSKENIISTSNLEGMDETKLEELLKDVTSLKRSKDRFPYFALRFLDERKVFNEIRFQINLGRLLMDEYPKIILGSQTNRKIYKRINVFGRLTDFLGEGKEISLLERIGVEHTSKVKFEQYAPHYLSNNNKIGLCLAKDDMLLPTMKEKENKWHLQQYSPKAFLSVHELPKIVLLELLKPGASEKIIKKYLKVQESFLMQDKLDKLRSEIVYTPETFTRRIEDAYKRNISREEKQKRKEYVMLLSARRDVLDNALRGQIKSTQLPTRIKDKLMRIEPPSEHKLIRLKVKHLMTETKKRKLPIRNGQWPKIGEIATFIARDIINMIIDESIKQKITSVYYNRLQNLIAYFGLEKEAIITLCHELNIFEEEKGHVFLTEEKVRSERDILGFYRFYLDEKEKWIQRSFVKYIGNRITYIVPIDKPIPFSMQKHLHTSFDFERWVQNKINHPVDLPANLFDDNLIEVLREKLNMRNVPYGDKDRFAKLLELYLDKDTQPFYAATRKYKVYQTNLIFNLAENRSFKELFDKNIDEIRRREEEKRGEDKRKNSSIIPLKKSDIFKKGNQVITENEKSIRFVETKDRVARLMCEALIKEDTDLELSQTFLLENIYPGKLYNPLDLPVTFRQTIPRKNKADATKKIIARNTNIEGGYKWKVKDFGVFKKLIHDRRLDGLLQYFSEEEVPISIIEHELKEYDVYRERFFDEIFNLEKAIVQKDRNHLKIIAMDNAKGGVKKHPEVQFKKYIAWLKEKNIHFDESLLMKIRNAMSHTQFPEICSISTIDKNVQENFDLNNETKGFKEGYSSIIKQLYLIYKEEIAKIIKQISILPMY